MVVEDFGDNFEINQVRLSQIEPSLERKCVIDLFTFSGCGIVQGQNLGRQFKGGNLRQKKKGGQFWADKFWVDIF